MAVCGHRGDPGFIPDLDRVDLAFVACSHSFNVFDESRKEFPVSDPGRSNKRFHDYPLALIGGNRTIQSSPVPQSPLWFDGIPRAAPKTNPTGLNLCELFRVGRIVAVVSF